MKQTHVKAFAKVNLVLNVLGKRPDGYHEIESFMQAIGLCDDIWIACEDMPSGRLFISLDPGSEQLPSDERNLAYRAAALMHDTYHPGRGERIKITVHKRIPVAAGLAGGSADGAALLRGLAKLWDIPVDRKLYALAAALGSDVPFCLAAQTGRPAAIARGTGTELQFVSPVDCRISVRTPKIEVPTPAVYSELRPEDSKCRIRIGSFLSAPTLEMKAALMQNHLQAPACRLFPQIGAEIERLKATGKYLAVLQSGSGPSIICVSRPTGEKAAPQQTSGAHFSDAIAARE